MKMKETEEEDKRNMKKWKNVRRKEYDKMKRRVEGSEREKGERRKF